MKKSIYVFLSWGMMLVFSESLFSQATAEYINETEWYKGFHSYVRITPNGDTFRNWRIVVSSQIDMTKGTVTFTDPTLFPAISVVAVGNTIEITATDFGIEEIEDVHFNINANTDLPESNTGANGVAFPTTPVLVVENLDDGGTHDFDNDGILDRDDSDDDNDSYADIFDAFPYDAAEHIDSDNDGIGNNADPDDDNDGTLDDFDAFPYDATETLDTDNDGIGNNADADDDNDGIFDIDDETPLIADFPVDTDGDGIIDDSDDDDDGDGVLDIIDAFPLNALETMDSDSDGIGNSADTDDDNDGVEDSNDALPLDPFEYLDTDSDGIGNNADNDDDNDGITDGSDPFPLDPTESMDTDGDGIGNNADTDDDGDGIADVDDAHPLIYDFPEGYFAVGNTVDEVVLVDSGKIAMGTDLPSTNTLTVAGGATLFCREPLENVVNVVSDFGVALQVSSNNGKILDAYSGLKTGDVASVYAEEGANGLSITTNGEFSLKSKNTDRIAVWGKSDNGTAIMAEAGNYGRGLDVTSYKGTGIHVESDEGTGIISKVVNATGTNYSGLFIGSRFKVNADFNDLMAPGLIVDDNNRVGVGIIDPQVSLHVSGTDAIVIPVGDDAERPNNPQSGMLRYSTSLDAIEYFHGGTGTWIPVVSETNGENPVKISNEDLSASVGIQGKQNQDIVFVNNGQKSMTITRHGQVAIGTDTIPVEDDVDYKLAVNGGIAATMVKVRTSEDWGWPDFVFDSSYSLKSLNEIEAFISKQAFTRSALG